MAGRMSNRDRIQHLRAEAEAAAKEKAAARAEKAARPPATRKSASKAAAAPSRGRIRIVWNVCDPSGKEVKQFPFAQEQEARAEAAQLSASTGRTYFVMKAEVPFA